MLQAQKELATEIKQSMQQKQDKELSQFKEELGELFCFSENLLLNFYELIKILATNIVLNCLLWFVESLSDYHLVIYSFSP